jgi:hypothetical protein
MWRKHKNISVSGRNQCGSWFSSEDKNYLANKNTSIYQELAGKG